ncbi:MAG: NAD(P)/FAD-dependent oxidoreductase [Pseudomonadota bacterium]
MQPSLPEATEIVVIGGGVAGVATAWYLHRFGVPVVLCEKGRIAGEQSSRNWGWIRKQGRHPAELELIVQSLRLWQEIVDEVPDDIGWHVGGVAYLVESDADAARYAAWLEHAKAYQLDSRLLSKAETDSLIPGNRAPHQGALFTPSDARAEPGLAVPAMARHLRAAGVPILEGCAVRTVERAGGRVVAVATEHGRIRCRGAVVAGGAWSSTLLRHLGIDLPQLQVISSVQRTEAAPPITESAVGAKAVSLRRRRDGGYSLAMSGASTYQIVPDSFRHLRSYLPVIRGRWRELSFEVGRRFFDELTRGDWDGDRVSPFERVRVLDPKPNDRLLDRVLAAARRYYPQLEAARPAERWAGAIDVLPDEIPALGPVPDIDGLLVATGFSGHGFGIGPAAGRVTAELAAGRTPSADLAAFRIDRFRPKVD